MRFHGAKGRKSERKSRVGDGARIERIWRAYVVLLYRAVMRSYFTAIKRWSPDPSADKANEQIQECEIKLGSCWCGKPNKQISAVLATGVA